MARGAAQRSAHVLFEQAARHGLGVGSAAAWRCGIDGSADVRSAGKHAPQQIEVGFPCAEPVVPDDTERRARDRNDRPPQCGGRSDGLRGAGQQAVAQSAYSHRAQLWRRTTSAIAKCFTTSAALASSRAHTKTPHRATSSAPSLTALALTLSSTRACVPSSRSTSVDAAPSASVSDCALSASVKMCTHVPGSPRATAAASAVAACAASPTRRQARRSTDASPRRMCSALW